MCDKINPELELQARLLRRSFRRARARLRWRRLSLQGVPVLFANSFPKSGTHLLTQVLEGFNRLGPAVPSGLPAVTTFAGDSGRTRPPAEIRADLQRFLPGDCGYGHIHTLPAAVEELTGAKFAPYFILRDPRDVVVSHVHYITELAPGHVLHRYYTQELGDFPARLRTSILGLPEADFAFPDIYHRFEPYLGWLEQPEVLTLHYEDFIHNRERTLSRVWQHAVGRGFPAHFSQPEVIEILNRAIKPHRSPTFRQGRTGAWKDRIAPAEKELFKQVSGDLLIRLGYERDHDW